ncbi:Filament-like plant protein [Arabidopsis thaliana x Arabidopsis arenosa]|uniref:Filament-like plant protein n=1 Tax=Arabidopsis thaliana x Arabidopsis arenosa TaxID=1240361 RepID=A0A8T2C7V2_9BRAS|nr:Filament-like plant protein [Arabidopsis thaliana x Arabidopsis arenosa]
MKMGMTTLVVAVDLCQQIHHNRPRRRRRWQHWRVLKVLVVMEDFLACLPNQSSSNGSMDSKDASGDQKLELVILDAHTELEESDRVQDPAIEGNAFAEMIEGFSVTFNHVLRGDKDLDDFVSNIANVFNEAVELKVNFRGLSSSEVETLSPDCIDKVALPDSKVVDKIHLKKYIKTDVSTMSQGFHAMKTEFWGYESDSKLQEIEELKLDLWSLQNALLIQRLAIRCHRHHEWVQGSQGQVHHLPTRLRRKPLEESAGSCVYDYDEM